MENAESQVSLRTQMTVSITLAQLTVHMAIHKHVAKDENDVDQKRTQS